MSPSWRCRRGNGRQPYCFICDLVQPGISQLLIGFILLTGVAAGQFVSLLHSIGGGLLRLLPVLQGLFCRAPLSFQGASSFHS